jgi:hypothetical protein
VVRVRTDVSEEHIASIIRVARIGELGTAKKYYMKYIAFLRSMLLLLVTANAIPSSPIFVTLLMEATPFSETSVPTRATGVTGTAYLFIYRCSYLTGSTACYGDCLTFYMWMFVPHRKHGLLQATGVCCFILYVGDVRTSQETHPWVVSVC